METLFILTMAYLIGLATGWNTEDPLKAEQLNPPHAEVAQR